MQSKILAISMNLQNLKTRHIMTQEKFKYMSDSIRQSQKLLQGEDQFYNFSQNQVQNIIKEQLKHVNQDIFTIRQNQEIEKMISELEIKILPENVNKERLNRESIENKLQDAWTFILKNEKEYDKVIDFLDKIIDICQVLPHK